ncbi:hypothetical protein VTO42DRAFT_4017 [Malbranchea cinnamomea]
MEGVGGTSQEITWQRYNGGQRLKLMPSGGEYGSPNSSQGIIARRYRAVNDKSEELWTEITKDFVVKEAIKKAGYEYEKTDNFFLCFRTPTILRQSDEFRRARPDRIREIQRERAAVDPPLHFASSIASVYSLYRQGVIKAPGERKDNLREGNREQ